MRHKRYALVLLLAAWMHGMLPSPLVWDSVAWAQTDPDDPNDPADPDDPVDPNDPDDPADPADPDDGIDPGGDDGLDDDLDDDGDIESDLSDDDDFVEDRSDDDDGDFDSDDADDADDSDDFDEHDDAGDDGDDGRDDDDAPDLGAGTGAGSEIDLPSALDRDDRDTLADGREFEADEILALDLSAPQLARAKSLGFAVIESARLIALSTDLLRLRVPDHLNATKALAQIRAADPLGSYDLNLHYRLAQDACTGVRCYGQALVGISAPTMTQACAASPRIAVLDTAVDPLHPALRGARIRSARIGTGPSSSSEHGTAVAALIVGRSENGIAGLLPQAELLVADVFRQDQGVTLADAARVIQGIDWAIGQKASVINMSLTGPHSPLLEQAVGRAAQRGVVLVAAAGNDGPSAAPLYPAAYPTVLAITAVDRRLQPWAAAARGSHIALAAPGVSVWTADARSQGRFQDGTSFASPFVAAAAGVILSREPLLAPEVVAQRLRGGARDLGAAGPDAIFGAGLVQMPTCAK